MPLRLLSGSVLASSVCPPGLCNQVAVSVAFKPRLLLGYYLVAACWGLARLAPVWHAVIYFTVLSKAFEGLRRFGRHQQRYLQVTCCLFSTVCCARGCS